MSDLRELPDTRQVPGEPRRRWFHSLDLDLIVWFDDADKLIGFQLCYDTERNERAITWREGRGYDHSGVDSGETPGGVPGYKATPILVADGAFDTRRVLDEFLGASNEIPDDIRSFVAKRLERYPEG